MMMRLAATLLMVLMLPVVARAEFRRIEMKTLGMD